MVRLALVEILYLALVETLRLVLLVKFLVETRVSSVGELGLALLAKGLFERRACPGEVQCLVLLLVSAGIRVNNLHGFQAALQTFGHPAK